VHEKYSTTHNGTPLGKEWVVELGATPTQYRLERPSGTRTKIRAAPGLMTNKKICSRREKIKYQRKREVALA
jgi:hypothetical protein